MMRILLLPMFIRRYLSKIRPQENFAFFRQLAKQVVKQRREGNVKRNDFVQLLMDAYVDESELKKTSYETLTASNEKEGLLHLSSCCNYNIFLFRPYS